MIYVDMLIPERDIRILERTLRTCVIPYTEGNTEQEENKQVVDDFYETLVTLIASLDESEEEDGS